MLKKICVGVGCLSISLGAMNNPTFKHNFGTTFQAQPLQLIGPATALYNIQRHTESIHGSAGQPHGVVGPIDLGALAAQLNAKGVSDAEYERIMNDATARNRGLR